MSLMALTGQLTSAIAIGTLASMKEGGNITIALMEALANPTVCYVPIYCESYSVARESEISMSMVMTQSSGEKQFVSDNNAPHPRVWTMTGYLRSLIPYLENFIYFKPTILLQKSILDQAMLSRKTVPLKTKDGEIVEVLIKSLTLTDEPRAQNTVQVSMTVQELPYLESIEGTLSELADAAKASLPVDALIATYSTAIVGAGAVSILGALL